MTNRNCRPSCRRLAVRARLDTFNIAVLLDHDAYESLCVAVFVERLLILLNDCLGRDGTSDGRRYIDLRGIYAGRWGRGEVQLRKVKRGEEDRLSACVGLIELAVLRNARRV